MEALSGTREAKLLNQHAIQLRDAAVLKGWTGIGPPDLVVLHKRWTPSPLGFFQSQQDAQYLHWVTGVPVTSGTSVSSYVTQLVAQIEENTVLPGLRGRWNVLGCSYGCYNAFQHCDLRVDYTLNGELTCKTIGPSECEITDEFWEEIYLSCILRALNEPPKRTRPLRYTYSLHSFDYLHSVVYYLS